MGMHFSERAQQESRPGANFPASRPIMACGADNRIKDAGYRRKQEGF
jgi:hypothetical protein